MVEWYCEITGINIKDCNCKACIDKRTPIEGEFVEKYKDGLF